MIDLYLGGSIGTWALEQLPNTTINAVLTLDASILAQARSRDLTAFEVNANEVDFDTAEIGLSVHYPRLIKQPLLSRYRKMYNLHPGYLPWGRGYYPVFWALWENAPAGATLHEITLELDEGAIVEQVQVQYSDHDTGYTLFTRVREAEKQIFNTYIPQLLRGEELPTHHQIGTGTYHSKSEFVKLKTSTNWREMSSTRLLDLVRCLTFPDYSGMEVELGGTRFAIKLESMDPV